MDNIEKITLILTIVTLGIVLFNTQQLIAFEGFYNNELKAISQVSQVSGVIPTGIPKIYGNELQLSYDDVSAYDPQKADYTISKLGQFDRQINLEGDAKERYINILYKIENGISCEYCCGAKAIIFENGEAACGCAHSYAMRGLTKYLITNHGEEFTDKEILEEIAKWKTLFFPSQIQIKAKILLDNNIEPNFINLGSNKYRGIEKGVGGGSGMVGGC